MSPEDQELSRLVHEVAKLNLRGLDKLMRTIRHKYLTNAYKASCCHYYRCDILRALRTIKPILALHQNPAECKVPAEEHAAV